MHDGESYELGIVTRGGQNFVYYTMPSIEHFGFIRLLVLFITSCICVQSSGCIQSSVLRSYSVTLVTFITQYKA